MQLLRVVDERVVKVEAVDVHMLQRYLAVGEDGMLVHPPASVVNWGGGGGTNTSERDSNSNFNCSAIAVAEIDEIIYMCQSRVEIEYYSVAYFDHVTAFKVQYL